MQTSTKNSPQASTSNVEINDTVQEENNNNANGTRQHVTKPNYSCQVCNIIAPNNVVLQRHLNGKKHQSCMKKNERLLNGESSYACQFCSITANSQKQLDAHMAGWKHKQQVFRSDPLNMNEITYQRIIGIGFIVILVMVIFLCFLLLFKCYL